MKITRQTKWFEFQPFATPERVAQLKEAIQDCAPFDFWQLTIGDFSQMLTDGLPDILKKDLEKKDITIIEVIELMNAAEKFLTDFYNSMKNFEVELSPDEKSAAGACPEFTPTESMLIFAQKYFGHKDFGESEKITMIEYYIAKKSSYSDAVYQRRLSNIQIKKSK